MRGCPRGEDRRRVLGEMIGGGVLGEIIGGVSSGR